jgi:hypothetical protein
MKTDAADEMPLPPEHHTQQYNHLKVLKVWLSHTVSRQMN